MPDQTAPDVEVRRKKLRRSVLPFGGRLYALLILCVVAWTGYAAVVYLFQSVFHSGQVPANLTRWKTTMTAAMLRSAAPGQTAVPRAPFAHYHGVGNLFDSGPAGGCMTSGCHGPLPHTKHKEIRAFANLHTTFMTCAMCHDAAIKGTIEAKWVRDSDGAPTDYPAVLRLISLLETQAKRIKEQPAEVQADISSLLQQVLRDSGNNTLLEFLRIQLETSDPGSPVWRQAVDQLTAELPNHARGEYHAMLIPAGNSGDTAQREAKMASLAEQYLAAPAGSDARKDLNKRIHESVEPRPQGCLPCHGGEPKRLDFQALGYAPSRAQALANSSTARMMEQIRQGKPFYLPTVLEGK